MKFNRIPKKEPLIFISNHSNGFIDPVLIAALQMRPVYFWVRAIEFSGGFKSWFLYKLHGIPIYRLQDGRDKMHKNRDSLKITRELLYKNRNTVFVAPEGVCVIQKKLNRFKLGCAQMAFKMMEETNWGIDLKIQPIGVNYTYHEKFRSDVYVCNADPISVLDYKEIYFDSPANAVEKLTSDMFSVLREQMVYIEKGNEDLVEKLLVLARNNFRRSVFPLYSKTDSLFKAEKQIADYVNSLDKSLKNKLQLQIEDYYDSLSEEYAIDFAVAKKNNRHLIFLVTGFPVWALGVFFGYGPHLLARNLRNRFVPFPEFSTSFAFFAGLLVWSAWGVIIALMGALIIGWWAMLLPFILVFLQTFAYHYEDYFREWKILKAYKKVPNKNQIEKQRKAIKCLQIN
ncbi:1-acyl-sn-glycerol-3-phosphate acyltransferase [Aureispira]|nr:1-acyl-sn-glycerol-3-phosphate acyltransferase [Aureispira sp.]